jgi:hypothetical protein
LTRLFFIDRSTTGQIGTNTRFWREKKTEKPGKNGKNGPPEEKNYHRKLFNEN